MAVSSSPWVVQVKTGDETTWLDPAENKSWDHAKEILAMVPRCLELKLPSGKGLLERLPLPSREGQALQAARDGKEPAYLKILSRLLSLKLAYIVESTPPTFATASAFSRMVKAVLMFHSMGGCLWAASIVSLDCAMAVAGIDGGSVANMAVQEAPSYQAGTEAA